MRPLKISNQDRVDIFNAVHVDLWKALRVKIKDGNTYWAQQFFNAWLEQEEHSLIANKAFGKGWLPTVNEVEFTYEMERTVKEAGRIGFIPLDRIVNGLRLDGKGNWVGESKALRSWRMGDVVLQLLKGPTTGLTPALACSFCASLDTHREVPAYLRSVSRNLQFTTEPRKDVEQRAARVRQVLPVYQNWLDRATVEIQQAATAGVQLWGLISTCDTDKDLEKVWPEGERYWNPILAAKRQAKLQAKQLPAPVGQAAPDLTAVRQLVAKQLGLVLP